MAFLGERLQLGRRRRFVGRSAERELFHAALAVDEPPFAVLYLHGPGGIGKTTLLDAFREIARDAGVHVIGIDGRNLAPSPAAMLAALSRSTPLADDDTPIEINHRLVVLVDSYELLSPLDTWLRTRLLPRLPAHVITVIAGRSAPAAGWRADPGWHDLLRVITLRNLDPEESSRYVVEHEVPVELRNRLLELSHGHPLALSLLTELAMRGGAAPVEPLHADLVHELLRRFLDTVPDASMRRALDACALARVTTESLLRAVLGDDRAQEAFQTLFEWSFIESGPEGLFPHDLARDVLDADLRWRDPESYRQVFRSVAAHVRSKLLHARGAEQRSRIRDLKFLFRNLPGILSPIDWRSWGYHDPERAEPGDRDAVLGLVARAEGEASAAIAAQWWRQQPGGFHVLRDDRGVRGLIARFDLAAVSESDRSGDPGAQAAWDHARRQRPPRRGEHVTQTRFCIDRDLYQAPSPTLNAAPIVSLQQYLEMPALAWDYLTLFAPEPYDAYFRIADLHRAEGADFVVGGRRYGSFAHDFRVVPLEPLLEVWSERALAQDFVPPAPAAAAEVLVLSEGEFGAAVKQALRDLHTPAKLAKNPLQRARLVRDATPGETPDPSVLASLLRDAIAELGVDPCDRDRHLAVEKTYLDPAPNQEAAAERLGRPFSSYRRHLTQGIERVVQRLWQRELYGSEPHHE